MRRRSSKDSAEEAGKRRAARERARARETFCGLTFPHHGPRTSESCFRFLPAATQHTTRGATLLAARREKAESQYRRSERPG
jgi:hypothetical protein